MIQEKAVSVDHLFMILNAAMQTNIPAAVFWLNASLQTV
jgi:hypothetical protein